MSIGFSGERLPALGFHEPQAPVKHSQYAREFVATLHNHTGGGDHREGALPAGEPWVLDDLKERRFAGAPKNREYRAVGQVIDRIVAPFIGGDHPPIEL